MLTNQRVRVEWETHLLIMPGMHKQAAWEKGGGEYGQVEVAAIGILHRGNSALLHRKSKTKMQ